MIRKYVLLIFLILGPVVLPGRSQTPDSVLTRGDFVRIVKMHHPIVRQATLTREIGRMEYLMARGAFDPVLSVDWDNKRYNSTEYWRLFSSELKVPVWAGIDLKAGYEQNQGTYISDERTVPANGLAYAGVSIDLLKNLLGSERLLAVQQGRMMRDISLNEQKNILNNLFLAAEEAYREWSRAYETRMLLQRYVDISRIRFQAVKRGYETGAFPAIDTTEALIQLQNREFMLADAQLAEIRARNIASLFVWGDGYIPVELDRIYPQPSGISNWNFTQDSLSTSLALLPFHPEYQQKNLKIRMYEFERRYAFNSILPKLQVQYNFLAQPVGNNPAQLKFTGFNNNFKYGIHFKYPILMREGLGKYGATKAKLESSMYDADIKLLQLKGKLSTVFNEGSTYAYQTELYRRTVENYQRLLDAEIRKFDLGESSLFLLNSRESKLIESQQKLIELSNKNAVARIKFMHATGNLFEKYE